MAIEKATRFKKARMIALDAGRFVGTVERLILDLDARQVAGILMDGGRHAVDGEDVRALGEDAVTIATAERIIDLDHAVELASFLRVEDEVYRKEVFTVAGKKVGFITDVLIDASSRKIVGFEMFSEFLFPGDVHGIVVLNDEVIFGRDLVLVPSDIDRLIERPRDAIEAAAPSASTSVAPFERPPLRMVTARTPEVVASPTFDEASSPISPPEGEAFDGVVEAPDADEDLSIDFSGVDVPTPEVIREAPPPLDPSSVATDDRPDMRKIFASFPLGVAKQTPAASPAPQISSSPPLSRPASSPASSPGRESSKDKLIRFVLGKTSSRDILDVDGNLILARGEEITEGVVARAQAAELMPQVFLAASQGLHSRLKRS